MTIVIFDISKDGYNAFVIFPGVIGLYIASMGLYVSIKQNTSTWILRMSISLSVCLLWLIFASLKLYGDYTESMQLHNTVNQKIVEGYVNNTKSQDGARNCDGFTINSV